MPQPSVLEPLVRKDILHYDIFADFTREPVTEYRCELGISFLALTDLDTIWFDLIENTVDSVFVNGELVDFVQFDESIAIIPEFLGDTNFVMVHYRGDYPSDAIKYGFDLDGVGVAYSLFWPSLARFFYPCVDHPADKATSRVSIRTSVSSTVISNGSLEGIVIAPGDSLEAITTFTNDYPISTYNICFSFSENYAQVDTLIHISSGDIEIHNYFPSDWFDRAELAFADLSNMITFYDTLFGDYSFDSYGMYVTSFRAGAMEHQSMVMMGEFVLEDPAGYQSIIAHELSHQWFGNSVGLGDWRDFWLNEGMAVYCEVLYLEFSEGYEASMEYFHSLQQSYLDYAPVEGIFPVYDPDEYLSYTCYRKGAAVFHMLRKLLGDEHFFDGMSEYYARYKYRTVTTDSLFAVLEEISDTDLSLFREQWVDGAGWPVFGYWHYLDDSGLHLFIEQTADIYFLPMEIGVYQDGIEHIHTIYIDEALAHLNFDDVMVFDSLKFDPRGDILCEKTYLSGVQENHLPNDIGLNVYPNPFNSCFQIDGLFDGAKVCLLDIHGRTVKQWIHTSQSIDCQNLPSGLYTISTDDGKIRHTTLLLK